MCVMKAMPTNTPFYSTLNWIQSTYDSESTQCAFNLGPYFTLLVQRVTADPMYVDSCAMPTDRVCVCYLCSKPFKLGVYIMLSLGNMLHMLKPGSQYVALPCDATRCGTCDNL